MCDLFSKLWERFNFDHLKEDEIEEDPDQS
jgi:hypothetical protein